MQSFNIQTIPSAFTLALENIKRGRRMQSEGKKMEEIGKAYLAQFLLTERKCDLTKLPIDEIVNVNNGLLVVRIDKQTRFDAVPSRELEPVSRRRSTR